MQKSKRRRKVSYSASKRAHPPLLGEINLESLNRLPKPSEVVFYDFAISNRRLIDYVANESSMNGWAFKRGIVPELARGNERRERRKRTRR